MPSFDIISEVNMHELKNALDQSNKELTTRYDFKGVEAKFEQMDNSSILLTANADFQLNQMIEILKIKFVKRGLDIKCINIQDIYASGKQVKQNILIKNGINKENSKKIIKLIKDKKIQVQTSTQGEKIRISGKKRDVLQQVIAILKESNIELPLQFNNFRD